MFEIGRICMKIAGRDAGKICVVIDNISDKIVLIDGETRRRKCNINHLELLDKVVKVSKNAPSAEVVKALQSVGIDCKEKKEKQAKQKTERPKKKKVVKKDLAKESKQDKKEKPKREVKPKQEIKQPEAKPAAPKVPVTQQPIKQEPPKENKQ